MAAGSLPSSFLRRLSLVPLLLAIIAGIFGMHVLAGHHVQHGSAAAGPAIAAAPEHAAPVDAHGTHGHSPAATPAAPAEPDAPAQLAASTACVSGHCAAMNAAPAVCIPSAAAGSLAVPPPGTSPQPYSFRAAAAGGAGSYSYLPGTPTPADLCISRT
ncbi:hypothetical protein [Arthrobacter sp. MAHUQ-56]